MGVTIRHLSGLLNDVDARACSSPYPTVNPMIMTTTGEPTGQKIHDRP